MTNSVTELGTRTLFNWRGPPANKLADIRQANIDRLADLAAQVLPLFNFAGALRWLTPEGKLEGVTPDLLKRLIGEHIAHVKLVPYDGGYRQEYHAYEFGPGVKFKPTWAKPDRPLDWETEPDTEVLNLLFREELLPRLPRVPAVD